MASLIVVSGGPPQAHIDLTEAITVVGTGSSAHPWLARVSGLARRHTTFSTASDGSVTVTDMDTRSGTHVNGARLRGPHRLRPRDQVRMGDLIVLAASAPVPGAGAAPPPGPAPSPAPPPPPADPDAVFQQALALHRQHRVEAARQLLADALATHPDHLACRFGLAVCLVDLGRTGDAVDHLRTVLVGAPGHASATYLLGRCLADVGRTGEAVTALRQTLTIQPGHAGARALLASLGGPTTSGGPAPVPATPAAVAQPATPAQYGAAPARTGTQAVPDPAQMALDGNPVIQVDRSLSADIDQHSTAYAGKLIFKGNVKFRYLVLAVLGRGVLAVAATAVAAAAPEGAQMVALVVVGVLWLWVLAAVLKALVRSLLNDYLFYERCMELRLGILNRQTRTIWYYQMAPVTRVLTIANYLSFTASMQVEFEEAGRAKSVRVLAFGNLREVEQFRKELELHRIRERRQFKGITS
jgi:tetratricopeptide (TPR) repeat protein